TLKGAPGDRFDLEGTPAGVTQTVLTNASGTRGAVYAVASTVPLDIDGDFAVALGQRLHADGTVEAVGHLGGLPVALVFNFDGHGDNCGVQVTFDGSADPP